MLIPPTQHEQVQADEEERKLIAEAHNRVGKQSAAPCQSETNCQGFSASGTAIALALLLMLIWMCWALLRQFLS